MIQSQATQVKLLKATLDKSISDMMHDLQETRKHEVKNLTTVRRDKDEFERCVNTIFILLLFLYL